IFAFLSLCASAQRDKKNILKANILSPIFNTLNLSYERVLKGSNSLTIGASYMDFDDFGNSDYRYPKPNRVNGGSLTAEYRIYFEDKVLHGSYFAPFIRYMYYERNLQYNVTYSYYDPVIGYTYGYEGGEKDKYQGAGIGFIAGYQFIIKNVFSIDLFGGPVYQLLLQKDRKLVNTSNNPNGKLRDEYLSENIPNRYLYGYGFRAGITLGMLF
ncbi:MAG: DUF3575 domain-containing protein, partial [Bacteroidota bacterium]